MKICDVVERIKAIAPENYSNEYVKVYNSYDNSGFLVGDMQREFTSCVLCLDVTFDVIKKAKEIGANLIVSHHPVIFSPILNITTQTVLGKNLIELIKSDIAVYSCHLSLDIIDGGINDILCHKFGAFDCKPLFDVLDSGLGRIGKIKTIEFAEFCANVNKQMNDSTMWVIGENQPVSTIAIIAGGGGGDTENIIKASKLGADVYISADFKHHVIVLAREIGLKLISLSHYKMETVALEYLKSRLDDIECHIDYGSLYI